MRSRLLLLAIVMVSAAPAIAAAQGMPRLGPGPARVLWQRPSASIERADASEPLGGILGPDDLDYRYTGFFVAATLGLAATAFGFAWCQTSDRGCPSDVVPTGILMSGVLGLSGALVGGFLPKAKPSRRAPLP